jgi:hypothetical protein
MNAIRPTRGPTLRCFRCSDFFLRHQVRTYAGEPCATVSVGPKLNIPYMCTRSKTGVNRRCKEHVQTVDQSTVYGMLYIGSHR